jgi:hypothetical protein
MTFGAMPTLPLRVQVVRQAQANQANAEVAEVQTVASATEEAIQIPPMSLNQVVAIGIMGLVLVTLLKR